MVFIIKNNFILKFYLSFILFNEIIALPLAILQQQAAGTTTSRRSINSQGRPQRPRLHSAASFPSHLALDEYDEELISIGKGGVINANKSLNVLTKNVVRDFDPILSKGVKGNPGIKARINSPTFEYFSTLLAPIIDREIRQARIPPTLECISKLNGCIQVYNIYISHYRCPKKITIFPSPPFQLVVRIENLGIGIIGNIIGDLNIIIPIKLSGIIHVNAQQVSTTVQLGMVQSGIGPPIIQVVDCQVSIGYVDAFMEDGGIIGAIANREFRHQMNQQIRAMIPKKICERIPEAINSRLNPKLTRIPQAVALLEMLQLINGALALGGGNNVCESTLSPTTKKICKSISIKQPAAPVNLLPVKKQVSTDTENGSETESFSKAKAKRATFASPLPIPQRSKSKNFVVLAGSTQRFHNGGGREEKEKENNKKSLFYVPTTKSFSGGRDNKNKKNSRAFISATTGFSSSFGSSSSPAFSVPSSPSSPLLDSSLSPAFSAADGINFIKSSSQTSNNNNYATTETDCVENTQPPPPKPKNAFCRMRKFIDKLDISSLKDISLTTNLIQTYATKNDYTIAINGEFSQFGRGGTPFGAYFMDFPENKKDGNKKKMIEILVSDFTLNSLFYIMHKKMFLSFMLDSNSPSIGGLLKTTCGENPDEEDNGIEDSEEIEIPERVKPKKSKSPLALIPRNRRRRRQAATINVTEKDDAFSSIGLCLGDLFPILRHNHPNQNVTIQLYTKRAPSIIFSHSPKTTAVINLILMADLFIDSSKKKVGTLLADLTIKAEIKIQNQHVSGKSEITNFKIISPDGILNVTQETLDQFAEYGKSFILQAMNEALETGIKVKLPSSKDLPLPFMIEALKFDIVDHGIYVSFNFDISPVIISQLTGNNKNDGSSRNQCSQA